jgi:1-acyl-sn-glycerol-3-phosphate acyltransferase
MRKLLRYYHSFLCWLFGYLTIIILSSAAFLIANLLFDQQKMAYHFVRKIWARILLLVACIRIEVKGNERVPRNGKFIYAVNHTSTLDIVVLSAVLPNRYLFIVEEILFRVPIFGQYLNNSGDLPVAANQANKVLEQFMRMVKKIREGNSIVIFPEGGRSDDGTLMPFKPGIGYLVEAGDAQVVPVAIKGLARLMPRTSPIFYPGTAKIELGAPIRFAPEMNEQEKTKLIEEKVAALLSA